LGVHWGPILTNTEGGLILIIDYSKILEGVFRSNEAGTRTRTCGHRGQPLGPPDLLIAPFPYATQHDGRVCVPPGDLRLCGCHRQDWFRQRQRQRRHGNFARAHGGLAFFSDGTTTTASNVSVRYFHFFALRFLAAAADTAGAATKAARTSDWRRQR